MTCHRISTAPRLYDEFFAFPLSFLFFSAPSPVFSSLISNTRRMRIIILRPLFALSGKRDRVSFKFRRKTFETKNYIRPPLAPLNGIYSRNHGETCLCRAIIPRIFIVSLLSTHFTFLSFFKPYLPSPKSGTLYRNNAIPSRFDLNRSNRSKSILSIAMGIEESTRNVSRGFANVP